MTSNNRTLGRTSSESDSRQEDVEQDLIDALQYFSSFIMLSYRNNDINDEKKDQNQGDKNGEKSSGRKTQRVRVTSGTSAPRPCFSIAQIAFEDGFANCNMSRYFPKTLDSEDAFSSLRAADLPQPIPFTVANLPQQRQNLKPYVTSVSSENYFTTISKAPMGRCRSSETRFNELLYAPKPPMPKIVTKEEVDDFEDISGTTQDPKCKRKDLIPQGTSDKGRIEEYDLVDAGSDEILDMVVSDYEDEFEVLEKVGQSELNGTTRKWYKSYRR